MKLDKFTPTEELLLIYSCDLVQRNIVTKLKSNMAVKRRIFLFPESCYPISFLKDHKSVGYRRYSVCVPS